MSETRASAGGQIGLNGEFYKGGQFLPSSKDTVKGAQKPTVKKGTKKEVAPYVWRPAPADDMLSIYDRIRSHVITNKNDCKYVKGEGFVGLQLTRRLSSKSSIGTEMMDDPIFVEHVDRLVEMFNNGARWFPLADDPFHYKNQEGDK